MKYRRSRGLLASAVGVGVGVGVGLGLISARLAASASGGGGATAADVEAELQRLLVEGRETGVTFADFPYCLSEETRLALTNAVFPYLSQTALLPRHIKVFDATSRTILLAGQSELCLLSLAKAVAHQFNARLLALDVFEFMHQIQHKYGAPSNAPAEVPVRSTSTNDSTLDKVYGFVQSLNIFRKKADPTGSLDHEKGTLDLKTSFHYKQSAWVNISIAPGAKNNDSESMEDYDTIVPLWNLDEKILMRSLYEVVVSASECSPVILYIRDVDVVLGSSERAYSEFQKMLNKLSGRVSIIGSHFLDDKEDCCDVDDYVIDLFPYILETCPPKDAAHLEKWKTQMEKDMEQSKIEFLTNQVSGVLSTYNLECDDLSSIPGDDHVTILSYLDDILAPAVSYHLMNNKDPEYKNGRLILSSTSLAHGLKIFQESNLGKDAVERKEGSKVTKDNEYEKRIRESVIPASETGVTFDDIGALDDIKESVQELVRLPLQRPELFNGGLLKPCKGILLFGPPGTGKTMLAKAIANEAGASFMNISMSTIVSKWYGETEKSIRALFSLAAKIAPAVIFVDEVDSMLGTRDNLNENEVSRRVKNEFMTHWDGLLSKSDQRILVLAATNRPFDLDDAIIRRFEHRMMVGLPTLESRELIFKKLLSKEKVEGAIDFKELAKMTEGYSGSDLKNLCVTAAYRPVRELLKKEKEMKDKNKKEKEEKSKKLEAEDPKKQESGKEKPEGSKGKEASSQEGKEEETEETVGLRPLTMEDLKQAKDDVTPSFDGGGAVMNQIKQWNELYGKGGSRKKEHLTYFL
ncbi:hypothetical protein BS78_03G200000 [Paspalum vaginatum]|nr:hypothetical protein BS78_03G200000 [Paspalum vaginatum]